MMATEIPTPNASKTVDLEEYRNHGVILFSGRPKGEALRQKLNLDEVDKNPKETIKFIVPAEIVSLNSSFFLGLFVQSVKRLGEQAFRSKYLFEGPPEIYQDIESGISQALRESNPLPS